MIRIEAWLSLILALPAALVVARRAAGRGRPALSLLCGSVAYATLVVVPLQAEAALELVGLIDRIRLLGPAVASAGVLLVAARRRWRGEAPPGGSTPGGGAISAARRLPSSVKLSVAVIAALYAFVGLVRLAGYPWSWDGTMYHLPVAVGWLRDGSLALASDAHFYEAIPANGDIFSLLTLATGWYALTSAWNLASAAAVAAGTFVLARVAGADRIGGAVAALVIAGVPMVLHQTFSPYVDLFVAGYLLAAIALLAGAETGRASVGPRTAAIGAGLACGLAVGAKATAWPVASMITAAVAARLWATRDRRSRPWGLLALFLAGIAAPSLFWFARNWAATGNPAYPLEISVMGRTLLEGTAAIEITQATPEERGLWSQVARWLAYPWTEREGIGYAYTVSRGLGPLFAALAVPGALYTLFEMRPGRRRDGPGLADRRIRLALAGALAALAVCWWLVLAPVLRFGLVGVALLAVLGAPFFEAFQRRLGKVFGALLVTATVAFAVVAALPVAQSAAHRVLHAEWGWSGFYHHPPAFAELPDTVTVVNYDPGHEGHDNFALMGPELKRRVIPDWEVETALDRGETIAACSAYVIDRWPFDLEPGDGPFARGELRLVAETPARHGAERWRIWTLSGESCGSPPRAPRPGRRPGDDASPGG